MANRNQAKTEERKDKPRLLPNKPTAVAVRLSRRSASMADAEVNLNRAGARSVKEKEAILANFKKTKKKYNDPDFPPDKTSLTKNWGKLDARTKMAWSTLTWKRIDEVFRPPYKVFDSIEPGDIMQGALGDCYFLSALSAIAEFPHRIQMLFDTKDYEPAGCYIVSMLETGVIKDHIVDDYFPVDRSGKAAFSGPKVERGTAELWVVILEKAYANRFGSYDAIQAGFTEDVLRDLTGAPCEILSTEDGDCIWEKLMHGNDVGYIITAASGGDQDEHDTTNALGLVSLHAYSVIEAAEVPTRGGTECLLKIRNPWGATEWQGDWSDNSPLWTPELKRTLKWQNVDDGTFWMRLEDFQDWFTSVTICRVNDSFKYNAILVKQPKGQFKVFEVTLEEAARATLAITLPDQRHFGYDSGYTYPVTRLVACFVNEQDEGLNEFLGGRASIFTRDVWREFNTTRPGKLLVFAEVDWETDFTTEFGFSVYSSCASTITDVTDSYPDALSFIYSPTFCKQNADRRELRANVYLYEGERTGGDDKGRFNEGFLFHFLENKTKNLRATIEVQFPEFDNLELMYPDSGRGYRVVLEPSQFATIVIKHSVLTEQLSFSTRIRKEFQEV
jgi:calpain-15